VCDGTNAGTGYVSAAACTGEALLHIGLLAQAQSDDKHLNTNANEETSGHNSDWLDSETHALAKSSIQRCHGMGGTLEEVGKVVQAAVVGARGEIVGAKCVYFYFYFFHAVGAKNV
jgi:hypothetical protein